MRDVMMHAKQKKREYMIVQVILGFRPNLGSMRLVGHFLNVWIGWKGCCLKERRPHEMDDPWSLMKKGGNHRLFQGTFDPFSPIVFRLPDHVG